MRIMTELSQPDQAPQHRRNPKPSIGGKARMEFVRDIGAVVTCDRTQIEPIVIHHLDAEQVPSGSLAISLNRLRKPDQSIANLGEKSTGGRRH